MLFKGIVSGLALYILLVALDILFKTNTERLLLNIDFITGQATSPFLLEVTLHLLVSIILYFSLSRLFRYKGLYIAAYIVLFVVFIGLFFILSHLSLTMHYDLTIKLMFVWLLGHTFYLFIVHLMIKHAYS
ncbi:hypothetical protein [Macrococcus psychrotolerans]